MKPSRLLFFRRVLLSFLCILYLHTLEAQDCSTFSATTANTFSSGTYGPITRTDVMVRISGNVTFNGSVTFIGCIILLDPDAVVTINPGSAGFSTFSLLPSALRNTSIFACTSEWREINISAGTAVNFDRAFIGWGRRGIVFKNGYLAGSSSIINTTFSRNTVAITAENVGNLAFASFRGNIFEGRSRFNWVTQFLPPHGANEPFHAFRLVNTTGVIGTAGTQNIFQRFSTAIRAENSTITVNNSEFRINIFSDVENFGLGIGIRAIQSSLVIQNIFSNGVSCSFINNGRSIRSDRTINFTLQNASFAKDSVADIEIMASMNPANIQILNNTFTLWNPSQYSVFIERPAQAGLVHMRIQSNAWSLPDPGTQLPRPLLTQNIRFLEIRAPLGTPIIANNTFNNSYGNGATGVAAARARTVDAIWIQDNANGYRVSGNTITYVNPSGPINNNIASVAIGMTNVNGVGNAVGPNNIITSTLFANANNLRESWLRCGVHINNSQNILVCRNDANNAKHNFHYLRNCVNGEFGVNTIRNAIFGLLLDTAQFQARHDFRKNIWQPGASYQTNSARWNSPPLNLRWRVNNTLPGHAPPSTGIPSLVNPGGWFPNSPGDSLTPCDNLLPPPAAVPGGEPDIAGAVIRHLNGEFVFSTLVSRWDFEKSLLIQLLRYPSAINNNTQVAQFYNDRLNTNLWKLANAEYLLGNAGQITSTNQQSLDQSSSSQKILIDSIITIEVWEGADTLSVNEEWQQRKQIMLTNLNNHRSQSDVLLNTIRLQRLIAFQSAKDYISGINEMNKWEAGLKHILLMNAKYALGETGTPSDSSTLRSLAYSCPSQSGESVLRARSMLPIVEYYAIPREEDPDPFCGQPRSEPGEFAPNSINLWPNPASNIVNLQFEAPFSGQVAIFNTLGHLETEQKVTQSQSLMIPLEGIPNGIYFVQCYDTQNRLMASRRLMILR
jgi:hypothetical protein